MEDAPAEPTTAEPVASTRRLPDAVLPVVACIALLLLGAGSLAGIATANTTPHLLGPDQPIDKGARDPREISANNSPALASNPTRPANLVVANRIDLPRYSCALHVSDDGGGSWKPSQIPFPAGEEQPPRCYAPDVAFGGDGALYVSFVTLKGTGNVPSAVWVSRSTDGGRTLAEPVRAAGQLAFQVHLVASPKEEGLLYLTWLQAAEVAPLAFPTAGNPAVVSRSTDGGTTWSPATKVSPAKRQRVVAPSPALATDGTLFVAYLDLGDDRLDYAGGHEGRGGPPYQGKWTLVLAMSADRATSWSEAVIDEVVPAQRFNVFLPPSPAIAVSPNGPLYVAFTDARLGDPDVMVWTSKDGGTTFRRRRVNDTKQGDGRAQYLPKLALAPNDRLDVIYYDRRADPADVWNELSFQSSSNQAETFTSRIRVSQSRFDSRIGFGAERGMADLGSTLALLSTEDRAMGVWTDTRAGRSETGKQDLASAVLVVPQPSGPAWWRRAMGFLLLGAGAAGALLVTRARRSSKVMVAPGRRPTTPLCP